MVLEKGDAVLEDMLLNDGVERLAVKTVADSCSTGEKVSRDALKA